MKERGMLFSAPMVRALLAGDKTQTRRICKDQPHESNGMVWWPDGKGTDTGTAGGAPGVYLNRCPYGHPGDRLWVRETFAKVDGQTQSWIETDYRATYTHGDRLGDTLGIKKRWTPAIHMPRAASRINLEITGVRVERLQDVSEADAKAEGIGRDSDGWFDYLMPSIQSCQSPTDSYRTLWESLAGPGSWAANPWVWVIEFKREES